MTDTNEKLDTIYHLLEVEKNASVMISDATVEAEKRLSAAHSQYDILYKEKFEQIITQLEKSYDENLEKAKLEYTNKIESYKQQLSAQKINEDEFKNLLDRIFFA